MQSSVKCASCGSEVPVAAPSLITVDEVAAMLQVSQRTVYRFSDIGRIPRPIKLGGSVRWRRSDILAWIEEGCPSARPSKVR